MTSLVLLMTGCKFRQDKQGSILTVFHAGSLAVPMKQMADSFMKEQPGVIVRLEAAGSVDCIRKITELNRPCDVMALADYSLIDDMLIPEYATWSVRFASNELCLVYTDRSLMADQLSAETWFTILLDPRVRYGRSDPDSDPCGYRTILALQLASRCSLGAPGWEALLQKDTRYIRGKETDLIALLESRTIDYMFNYRSVAEQHGFRYLTFPDSVNLSNPDLADWYSTVSVTIRGDQPGSYVIKQGAPTVYGATVPLSAPNPILAGEFMRFLLNPDKGLKIMQASGQKALIPAYSPGSRGESPLF